MWRCAGVLTVVVLLPSAGRAAEASGPAPEQLLAADSVAYFRFDGLARHRKAYEQTALGELMQGDLGQFVDYLASGLKESLGPALAKKQLLSGTAFAKLKELHQGFDKLPEALRDVGRHGLVLGFELPDAKKGQWQLTVVFPDGGHGPQHQTLLAAMRLLASLADVQVKESKLQGRTVYRLDPERVKPVKVAWWQEGKHLVLVVGSKGPSHTMSLVRGKRPSLAFSPHFKSLQGFKEYETVARGFVDLAKLFELVRKSDKAGAKLFEELVLGGFQRLTLQFGFEGKSQRSTIALQMRNGRRGFFSRASGSLTTDRDWLPPLPPDATSIRAIRVDLAALFDMLVHAAEKAAEAEHPGGKAQVQAAIQQANQTLGIDIRKDLLGSLGSNLVIYNSPSDGAMSLGFGIAIKVRDAKKLQAALKRASKSLPATAGVDLSVKTQTYHGVAIHTLYVRAQGFFLAPSYALHKDWLVLALFPQTVEGSILRSGGKYAAWKPTPLVEQALAAAKRHTPDSKIIAVSMLDPRPVVRQLCTLAAVIAGLVNSFAGISFDISKIPNAQVLTEGLFPNVAILLDDGNAVRLETYDSLPLPLVDAIGLDNPLLLLIAAQVIGSFL